MLLKNRINKTIVDISSILLQILEAGNVLMKLYSEIKGKGASSKQNKKKEKG